MRPERLDVLEQVISCTACQLHESSGPVPFRGPNPVSIAVMGEAPGVQEYELGKAFVGEASALIAGALAQNDIDMDECFVFNAVSCHAHGDLSPESIKACAGNREAQIAMSDPTWVLLLGKVALSTVKPGLRIGMARGRPFRPGNVGPVYFATYHPAAGLRRHSFEEDMRTDVARFAKMVGDGIESWQKYMVETCWECAGEEIVWWDDDGVTWCERHAPAAYFERKAVLEQEYQEAVERLSA